MKRDLPLKVCIHLCSKILSVVDFLIPGGGGHILCKGLSAGHVDLGHIDTLLAGTSKTLAFNLINTHELELEDGYLQCDLFLDEGIVSVAHFN